jgi:hypothetical protein
MQRTRKRRWPYVVVGALMLALLAACAPGRPFADWSPWNQPLGNVGWRDEPALRSGHSWVNLEDYSVPVVYANANDPWVQVSVPSSWGWPGGVVGVHLPGDVTGSPGSDGELGVVEFGYAYSFYQFQRTGPFTARASAWAAGPMDGSGWGSANPFQGAGVRASGSSVLGGLITAGDFNGGDDFRHALAVSLLGSELANGHVGPAIGGEGGSGSIPIGARIGIPPGSVMPPGLSDAGARLWVTLARYGAYVVDLHGGNAPVVFYADPRSVSPDRIAPLRAAGGDMDRIMPWVKVVA